MGAICTEAESKTFGTLEEIAETSTKSQYIQADIQEVPFLRAKVTQIQEKDQQFRNYKTDKILFKHKLKNLYYLGDWSNAGYQKGKGIIYYADEYLYYGDIDTVPKGKGVFESISSQFVYEGEFNYGRIQGSGKVQSKKGIFSFEGIFNMKSEPTTGNLVINNPNDPLLSFTVFLNDYPQNKARIVYKEGRQYQGEIDLKLFVPHGFGQAKYTNNSYYEGQWKNGQFHGKGKFVWPDGQFYQGQYSQGKKQGFGIFTFVSKKCYKGQWLNGKQHGEGQLDDSNGSIEKKGVWRQGKLQQVNDN